MTALASLFRAGAVILEPLERTLADPGECGLRAELGYEASLSSAAHGQIAAVLPVADALRTLLTLVEAVDEGGAVAAVAMLQVAEETAGIVRAAR